jgi:hypothetical protein
MGASPSFMGFSSRRVLAQFELAAMQFPVALNPGRTSNTVPLNRAP